MQEVFSVFPPHPVSKSKKQYFLRSHTCYYSWSRTYAHSSAGRGGKKDEKRPQGVDRKKKYTPGTHSPDNLDLLGFLIIIKKSKEPLHNCELSTVNAPVDSLVVEKSRKATQ